MTYINKLRGFESEQPIVTRVEGHYLVRARNRYGRITREREFRNLITNNGMNNLAIASNWNFLHLGTGTGAPSNTDSALDAKQITFTRSSAINTTGGKDTGGAEDYLWRSIRWQSTVGGATGSWTELGVSSESAGNALCSRSLFLDQNDLPTSFPVLSDELIDVTYEIRFYIPTADVQDTISMSGTSYDVTTRRLSVGTSVWGAPATAIFNINTSSNAVRWFAIRETNNSPHNRAYTGGLVSDESGTPAGDIGGATSYNNGPYIPGSFELVAGTVFAPGTATGTIRTVTQSISSWGCYQTEYDPPLAKTADHLLVHNLKYSWARK